MTTVVYHSADYDGLFCREIAKKFLGEKDVQYLGWNFGDKPLTFPPQNEQLIVMDLPLDKPFGLSSVPLDRVDWGNITWIDHHKSAIDSHPKSIHGYRIDGVAACRLAWQWFSNKGVGLPCKDTYLKRLVKEPMAVRLAGEYDIWDHRGDGDLELQFGLRVYDEPNWELLLGEVEQYTRQCISNGSVAMTYSAHVDASTINQRGFLVEFEGLRFLALNTARCNSLTFAARDVPETGHDALMGFYWNGSVWMFSLYHAAHRKNIDLSVIAVKHGGGGHRGACGWATGGWPSFGNSVFEIVSKP